MADTENNSDNAHRRLLDPSELGTQEYWEAAYSREIKNHQGNADDEGTIWFSENGAEEKVLKHLIRFVERGLLARNCRFLDLGTGNGHMLFALREEDDDDDEGKAWNGEMIGVDYSQSSVQLARQIATQHGEASTSILANIRFERWDILLDEPGDWLETGFDVVLDKGTFDAISLMPHTEQDNHPCELYRQKVIPLIKPSSFLFITSCNWTKKELVSWLAPDKSLILYDEAKYPTFTFGGRTGQSIVTAVFQRKAE